MKKVLCVINYFDAREESILQILKSFSGSEKINDLAVYAYSYAPPGTVSHEISINIDPTKGISHSHSEISGGKYYYNLIYRTPSCGRKVALSTNGDNTLFHIMHAAKSGKEPEENTITFNMGFKTRQDNE